MQHFGPMFTLELLYFVNSVYGKHPDPLIKTTIIDFYQEDEVINAKQLLVCAVDDIGNLDIHMYSKNRIGVNKMKASIDDIMNIYRLIDENSVRDTLPLFCAVNKSRLPVFADELSDLAAIKLELSQLRQHVSELSVLTNVKSELSQLRHHVSDLSVQQLHSCRCKRLPTPNTVSISSAIDCQQPVTINNDEVMGQTTYDQHQYDAAAAVVTVTTATEGSADSVGNDNSVSVINAQPKPDLDVLSHTVTDQNVPSYLETFKANMDKFELVHCNKKKNDRPKQTGKAVVGESTTSLPFAGVPGVGKKAVVCVSRLESKTSVQAMEEFLQSKDISVLSCYAYTDKHKRYAMMRVCIPYSDAEKMYVARMWPAGVVVRPWVFKPASVNTSGSNSTTQ